MIVVNAIGIYEGNSKGFDYIQLVKDSMGENPRHAHPRVELGTPVLVTIKVLTDEEYAELDKNPERIREDY